MQAIDQGTESYVAGSCNLGKAEIRRRYRIGYIGIALTICTILMLEYVNSPRIWRLIIFIPLFYGVSGFVQGYKKFCYVYGFGKVFSTTAIRSFQKVNNKKFIDKDRKTAIQIVSLVFLISFIITVIYWRIEF